MTTQEKKVYIAIYNRQTDRTDVVQYAKSIEHARTLIEKVMEPLQAGFSYKIISI